MTLSIGNVVEIEPLPSTTLVCHPEDGFYNFVTILRVSDYHAQKLYSYKLLALPHSTAFEIVEVTRFVVVDFFEESAKSKYFLLWSDQLSAYFFLRNNVAEELLRQEKLWFA